MIKTILKAKTILLIGITCILTITSCSVTINAIENSPRNKSYDKPLFIITYDNLTKYINMRLEKAFINELDNQKYSTSFILIEKPDEELEITNSKFPIQKVIKDSIAIDTSDLFILIQPIGANMTVPGMAITRVDYLIFCIDKIDNGLIWSAVVRSQNLIGGNIDTKRTANEILKRLADNRILDKLILID